MNELSVIFEQEILDRRFSIYGTADAPLFLAKDVADWIGHSDVSTMVRSIDDDEKLVQTMFVSGQNRDCLFLTEDGMYEVLMQSRKPIAKQFKKEVKRILQSIRKHGAYMTPKTLEAAILNPDMMIRLCTALKDEQDKRRALETQVKADKPKVLFADAVSTAHTSILVGELAKLLKQNGVNIGQNRLFTWMRDNGYLIRRNGTDYNMPTQKAMELNLFEIKETVIAHADLSLIHI